MSVYGPRERRFYPTYAEAREAAHKIGFTGQDDFYKRRAETDPRLPSAPHDVYAKDWVDWYDFLGKKKPNDYYPTYQEARKEARKHNFDSGSDYRRRVASLDPRLPKAPQLVYGRKGWVSWYDFLGKKDPNNNYPTYDEAKEAVKKLKISTAHEYFDRAQTEDPRLPSDPMSFYGKYWVDWYDFLGNKKPGFYPTYAEAKEATQKLGFTDGEDYKKHYGKDPLLPSNPHLAYEGRGWTNWYDFLGTEPRRPRMYETFTEAREAARKYGFLNRWHYNITRLDKDIRLTNNPKELYKDDWTNWDDYLGCETRKIDQTSCYPSYEETKKVAQKIGFATSYEYKAYSQLKDPRLPLHPESLFSKNGWVDWYDFLGNEKPVEPYPTYAKAKNVAHKLGFTSEADYKERAQKLDPRLPRHPAGVYAKKGWDGWKKFLKPRLYRTLEEAKKAVHKIGFEGQRDYKKRAKGLDSQLPNSPDQTYSEDWIDWADYLGKEKPRDLYPTYAEAEKSSQKHGFESRADYYKCAVEKDPRLPKRPDLYYAKKGWNDWYEYLGNEKPIEAYPTYAEAQKAAQQHGFVTSADYVAECQEKDPRLPKAPHDVYRDQWTSWMAFLGTKNKKSSGPFEQYEQTHPDWCEAFEGWLKNQTGIPEKRTTLRTLMDHYVIPLQVGKKPFFILSADYSFDIEAYLDIITRRVPASMRQVRHRQLVSFFDWVLDTYCTAEEDGEKVQLPGFRNPLTKLFPDLDDELKSHYKLSQSNKPPLGIEYVERARKFMIPEGAKTIRDLGEFAFDDESAWIRVPKTLIDEDDPNCVWREVTKERVNRSPLTYYEIFVPINLIALWTLFRIPLRGVQIVLLDSGEADELTPQLMPNGNIEWLKNTNPLATHPRAKGHQGVIRPATDDSGEFRLYITTNKTGRVDGGYHIDWCPPDLLHWLVVLRDWQAKYNPLEELTAWQETRLSGDVNEKILKRRGAQTFLFRDFKLRGSPLMGSPIKPKQAFRRLPELLARIQRDGEGLAEVRPDKKVKYTSQFTPHALRVSLITALIMDGGAPIEVVSKLVGHASIVMTLYYTVIETKRIKTSIAEADARALKVGQERLRRLIKGQRLSEAENELTSIDPDLLANLGDNHPAAAFQITDRGICSMSGASCDTGGEQLRQVGEKTFHAPVPPGYLGKRNCVRCRFFLTGTPFVFGLTALSNELSLEIQIEAERHEKFLILKENLEDKRMDCAENGEAFFEDHELHRAQADFEESSGKLDMLLCDLAATYRLLMQSIELLNRMEKTDDQTNKSYGLIATDSIGEVQLRAEENDSNYRLLTTICANAEIFTSANPSRAIPARSQMIDRMADLNGLAPAMFRLTEEQQLKAGNHLTSLLMKRTKSWDAIDKLFSGQSLLDELCFDEELKPLSEEVQQLLTEAGTGLLAHENKQVIHDA